MDVVEMLSRMKACFKWRELAAFIAAVSGLQMSPAAWWKALHYEKLTDEQAKAVCLCYPGMENTLLYSMQVYDLGGKTDSIFLLDLKGLKPLEIAVVTTGGELRFAVGLPCYHGNSAVAEWKYQENS